jgi:hypothetical protein
LFAIQVIDDFLTAYSGRSHRGKSARHCNNDDAGDSRGSDHVLPLFVGLRNEEDDEGAHSDGSLSATGWSATSLTRIAELPSDFGGSQLASCTNPDCRNRMPLIDQGQNDLGHERGSLRWPRSSHLTNRTAPLRASVGIPVSAIVRKFDSFGRKRPGGFGVIPCARRCRVLCAQASHSK